MNRKNFLQLAAGAVASLVVGDKIMPTNRFGDLIRDLRDPNLSRQRLEYIVQQLNEFGDREERYKANIQPGTNSPDLRGPVISHPFFATNALSPLTLNRTTDVSITQDVDTAISFETGYGSSQAFTWNVSDPTKIRIVHAGQGFQVGGRVGWAANATGYRVLKISYFDSAGNSLGTPGPLHAFKGFSELDNIFPFYAVVPQGIIPELAYFKILVAQGSGAGLNLIFADLHVLVS